MPEPHRGAALIDELGADDAQVSISAWLRATTDWQAFPEHVQVSCISAGIRSRHWMTASAARRFVVQRWDEFSAGARGAARDSFRDLLCDAAGGPPVWSFLADHWTRLAGDFHQGLSADVLRAALDRAAVAADAWDFLATHWTTLPESLTATVDENRLAAALDAAGWRTAVAAWDFLTDHWSRLPPALRAVVSASRMEAASRNTLTAPSVADFVAARG